MSKVDFSALLSKAEGEEKSERVSISKKREQSQQEVVRIEKKEGKSQTKNIDKLVSIKLYESSKVLLKESSYQTGKSQAILMGELIKRYLSELERELLEEERENEK